MKSILSAGALLLCCSTIAQAQSANWTFSYTGFYDREAAVFLPDMQLQGSFSGTDVNHDGVLDRTELTSFVIDTTDYVTCGAYDSPYSHCGADRFSYSTGGGLSFAVAAYGTDPEGWVGGGRLITTGDADYTYHYDPASNSDHHLMWTDGTRLTMGGGLQVGGVDAIQLGAVPAVPEAPAWGMLLGGLGGIGGWRLLRRRAA